MPRTKKYWKQRFGTPNTIAYHHHLDVRQIPDLDDEGFAYMLTNVKGVNMLDLNETDIKNASITLLTKLEYVNELRMKGCIEIDNNCIADLNKITSLQFLHVKNTGITIDGLLQLTALTKLREVLFSSEDADSIIEKLLEFTAMHPLCKMVIDGKPIEINVMTYLNFVMKGNSVKFKMKIKNEPMTELWSNWVINTSKNYYEAERQGPYNFKEIEWIEVDPISIDKKGKENDLSVKITSLLEELSVPMMKVQGLLRIYV